MPDQRAPGVEDQLSLREIAEALPGTGDLMFLVGQCWWRCAYAARGGNWPLADYYARRVRGIQRRLAIVRPKYRDDLAAFERDLLEPVCEAVRRHDLGAFETAFARATDAANDYHVKWGKAYIRWVLPDERPPDLEFGPAMPSDRT